MSMFGESVPGVSSEPAITDAINGLLGGTAGAVRHATLQAATSYARVGRHDPSEAQHAIALAEPCSAALGSS